MPTVAYYKQVFRRIRGILANKLDSKDLEKIMEEFENPLSLPVTSLDQDEVQTILDLTLVIDDEFDHIVPIPIPSVLSMLPQWIA